MKLLILLITIIPLTSYAACEKEFDVWRAANVKALDQIHDIFHKKITIAYKKSKEAGDNLVSTRDKLYTAYKKKFADYDKASETNDKARAAYYKAKDTYYKFLSPNYIQIFKASEQLFKGWKKCQLAAAD